MFKRGPHVIRLYYKIIFLDHRYFSYEIILFGLNRIFINKVRYLGLITLCCGYETLMVLNRDNDQCH